MGEAVLTTLVLLALAGGVLYVLLGQTTRFGVVVGCFATAVVGFIASLMVARAAEYANGVDPLIAFAALVLGTLAWLFLLGASGLGVMARFSVLRRSMVWVLCTVVAVLPVPVILAFG